MIKKEYGAHSPNGSIRQEGIKIVDAKVHKKSGKPKDLVRVLQFFRYKKEGATTFMCTAETGIFRGSVTWYVDYLMKIGELKSIRVAIDPNTGFPANFYSANKSLW